MRIINKLIIYLVLAAMTSTAYGFEAKTFIGLDSVAMETIVKYSNGSVTDEDKVNSLEYGLGINFSLTSNLTIYADYAVRNTTADFPTFISDGETEFDTNLISLGFNLLF